MSNQQKNMDTVRHNDTLYIITLLVIFALSALLMVLYGANIYNHIQQEAKTNDQKRIPLAYIASKVEQYDQEGCLALVEKQGNDVLILTTIDGGEPCETWLYTYEGNLCEMYVDQGAQFDLSLGDIIIPDCQLDMTLDQNILSLVAYDAQGDSQPLHLAVSSQTEGGAEND